MFFNLLLILFLLSLFGFLYGRRKANIISFKQGSVGKMHGLPRFHGAYVAFWCLIPNIILLLVWFLCLPWIEKAYLLSVVSPYIDILSSFDRVIAIDKIYQAYANPSQAVLVNDDVVLHGIKALGQFSEFHQMFLYILSTILLVSSFWYAKSKISAQFYARHRVEKYIVRGLLCCACLAVLTTLGIILSLFFEAWRFFQSVSPYDFLFGLKWSPQTPFHSGQAGGSGSFGFVPLFSGTMLITCIAMIVAAPIGLLSAIYMSDYASSRLRNIIKPLLEILAGIPTVVFGFFAALFVAPLVRDVGSSLGLSVASESALAAGLVMGVMIIPFISSLSDDVMNAVPQAMRDGSYGLGATKSETIRKVVLPAALPGIIAAMLLAISRAIGETMIVVMAAGLRANLTLNPLEDVTTVTVQIVSLLTGDQEFNTPKTLSVFALGLVLFFVTLLMNLLALYVVRKYREKYD